QFLSTEITRKDDKDGLVLERVNNYNIKYNIKYRIFYIFVLLFKHGK
ncbi:MAG: hypothetical protein ACD_7C00562G0003, partial [uncultured bacterium]